MRIERSLMILVALAISCGAGGLLSVSIAVESSGNGNAFETRRDAGLASLVRERYWRPDESSALSTRGNQLTLMFLDKARTKHPMYASLEWNKQGECIGLSIYPCWSVTDDEMQDFVMLNQLRTLGFKADALTDAGLRTVEKLHHLEKLTLWSAKQITPEGLARLKSAKPKLKIELH